MTYRTNSWLVGCVGGAERCPHCGDLPRWRQWVEFSGHWQPALSQPGDADGDALFAARLDVRLHLLWVCGSCGEVVS